MKRFQNVLFVAQPDTDERSAFEQAVSLARNNQARLTVLAVIDGPAIDTESLSHVAKDLRKVMISARREELESLVRGTSLDGSDIEIVVRVGKAFVEIIQEVLRHQRDIVIAAIKPPGSGGQRLFAGTLRKLLRKCPCPLWLIKVNQTHEFRNVLAAVAFEPDNHELQPLNTQILEMAASLALAEFSTLHVVHAWQLDNEPFFKSARSNTDESEIAAMNEVEKKHRQAWLKEIVSECTAMQSDVSAQYLDPQLHLVHGDAHSAIPECARLIHADLLVMGTVARSGIPGFLIGNTAEDILDQIDCSVLAIKPAAFVSPVLLTAPQD